MGYYGPFAIFPYRNCMFVVFVRYYNVIYLVPNKAVKKTTKKQHFMTFFMTWKTYRRTKIYNKRDINPF